MASLGNTTNNGSTLARTANILVVSSASAQYNGTVVSLSVRIWAPDGGSSNTPAFEGVIYSDNAGTPNTLLAITPEAVFTNTTEQVVTANFTGVNLISLTAGTTYWVGVLVHAGASPQDATISRAGTANGAKFTTTFTY